MAIKTIKKNTKVIQTTETVKYPIYSDPNDSYDIHYGVPEEIVHNCWLSDGNDFSIDIQINNKTSGNISFNTEELPHCCGLLEIGNLSVDNTIPNDEITKILDLVIGKNKGKIFILNTNGKSASIKYEAALIKCKYFNLVKTFKNKGTGSTIKVWMSNNE